MKGTWKPFQRSWTHVVSDTEVIHDRSGRLYVNVVSIKGKRTSGCAAEVTLAQLGGYEGGVGLWLGRVTLEVNWECPTGAFRIGKVLR